MEKPSCSHDFRSLRVWCGSYEWFYEKTELKKKKKEQKHRMGMNDVHKLETKLNAGVLTFHCSFIK
jgi:hypothetical protein